MMQCKLLKTGPVIALLISNAEIRHSSNHPQMSVCSVAGGYITWRAPIKHRRHCLLAHQVLNSGKWSYPTHAKTPCKTHAINYPFLCR